MSTKNKNTASAGFRQRCANMLDRLDAAQTSRLPVRLAYVYLTIPMLIFLFGWLRPLYAVLLGGILIAGFVLAWNTAPEMDVSGICRKNLPKLLGVAAVAALWMYLSGIGGFAYQNFDHQWRTAILDKLVNNDWPVIIDDPYGNFEHPAALIYYFALWLPAALIGKGFGMEAAQTVLFWWCLIGVLLCFTLILGLCKKVSVWIVLGFVCFSGLDAVGDFLLHNSTNYLWFTGNHIEYWIYGYQMSSMSTQLLWVFNQAIPAWIITLLLLHQKDNRSVIFIYSFSFLSCTLPAIGMLPILACIGIRRIVRMYDKDKPFRENIRPILRDALTFQNLCTGMLMALLSYLFIKSNTQSANGFQKIDIPHQLMCYLVFCFLEFVIYYLVIYRAHSRNALYWVSFLTLLVVPWIRVGYFADFIMRASIPALVVLFVLVMQAFLRFRAEKAHKAFAALLIVFLLGSLTAYHELNRTLYNTVEHAKDSAVSLTADEIDLIEGSTRTNFFGEIQDSFFFRYLAKTPE